MTVFHRTDLTTSQKIECAAAAVALADRPHRILALGVGCREMRRSGAAAEHDAAHGLDVAGLRSSIDAFLRRDH